MQKLRNWLWWKSRNNDKGDGGGANDMWKGMGFGRAMGINFGGEGPDGGDGADGISEALKKKDREKAIRQASRRRVRGGAPATAAGGASRGGAPAASGSKASGTPAADGRDVEFGEALSVYPLVYELPH